MPLVAVQQQHFDQGFRSFDVSVVTTEMPRGLPAILRDGRARTRTELVELTGLARATLSVRLDPLLEQQWVIPYDESVASGGRPATAFAFNPAAKVVLAADLGVTRARLAVSDPARG